MKHNVPLYDVLPCKMTLTLTTQNVQLHEIHMHAKNQVAMLNISKVLKKVKVLVKVLDTLTDTYNERQAKKPWSFDPGIKIKKGCFPIIKIKKSPKIWTKFLKLCQIFPQWTQQLVYEVIIQQFNSLALYDINFRKQLTCNYEQCLCFYL